jgi:hypothetical protein
MSKFNFLVENMLVDLREGRIPKSAQYSNIEIDASAFANKLNAGDMNEFIEAWSTKKWLGGLPAEKIKSILTSIAEDLTEYPPRAYTELWSQIETKVRDAVPTRKDLVQKMTRVIANLLTDPAFNLIKTVEASPESEESDIELGSEKEHEEGEELSEIAEKALEFVRQADEPSDYEEVVKYITGSFGKEEKDAANIIKSLIEKGLLEKQNDKLVAKKESGVAILDTDETELTGDEEHDEEIRRAAALEYDPDVEAAYREYLSSGDYSDNYNYND